MSDNASEQSNTLIYYTLLGCALVSLILWKFVFSPSPQTASSSSTAAAGSGAAPSSTRAGTNASTATTRTRRTPTSGSRSAASSNASKDSDDDAFAFGQPRHPHHLVAPAGWEKEKTDLSGCLLQGIVPFRTTPASGYETRLKKDTANDGKKSAGDLIVVNRRERARIFARMFSAAGGGGRPPNRGANIVVTIQHADVSCSKLQKALFLLGTYYNLFLLIDGSGAFSGGTDEETREFIKKSRSELLNQGGEKEGGSDSDSKEYKLNAEIIPPHRIAFSSTSKGRVAFVRQLHGTELVVDCDESVTKELERFGFRVLVYPKDSEGTTSALGNFLIP